MIVPGSLDYLYYNQVLDHIPYEAYEIIPAVPNMPDKFKQNLDEMMQLAKPSSTNNFMNNYTTGSLNGMNNFSSNYSQFAQNMPVVGQNNYVQQNQYSMYGNSMNSYQQMNGSQYLDIAKQGYGYNNNFNTNDTFSRFNNNFQNGQANQMMSCNNYGNLNNIGMSNQVSDGKSFRESILDSAKSTGSKISSLPIWITGTAGLGIMIWTLRSLLSGKKNPAPEITMPSNCESFWSKLNPKKLLKFFKK